MEDEILYHKDKVSEAISSALDMWQVQGLNLYETFKAGEYIAASARGQMLSNLGEVDLEKYKKMLDEDR